MTLETKERLAQQRQDFAELMKRYPFTTETLAGEEWRDIEGYNGKYQISNYGRVKSFWKTKPKILKPALNKPGYLYYNLQLQGETKQFLVHRLVAEYFIPNPDNKPEVNHIDGIRWNSCLSNLEWCTRSENIRHAHETGLKLASQGEKNGRAKVTNEQALYIRENPDGLNTYQLAEKFGVTSTQISNIQLGKTFHNAGGKIRTEKITLFWKLSPEIHNEIYRLYQTGECTCKQLCEKFGVAKSTIWSIIHKIDKEVGNNAAYRTNISEDDKKEIYRLYQTGEYSQTQLSKMFSVSSSAVWSIIHKIDKENGSANCYSHYVTDDIREKIRTEYHKGVYGCGCIALAKKYGCSAQTILNIVNEK